MKLTIVFFSIMVSHYSTAQNKQIEKPQIFGEGIISTGDYDTHPAFSPSGDTLYFLKCQPDASFCSIVVSYKKSNKWYAPEVVPFSGQYSDADPFITKDGNTMYFVSNRPVADGGIVKQDWDIWKTERNATGWGKPFHLDSIINTPASEFYPTLADNGNLYFGSSGKNGKGRADIYVSKFINNKYNTPENLGDSINTGDNEYEPFIAADESYLIFMATIPNVIANADFYISYNKNGIWSKAKKLIEPINSSATEWGGKVSRDGKYFFFGSNRNTITDMLPEREEMQQFKKRTTSAGNGLGDIYRVDFSAIKTLNMESKIITLETVDKKNDQQQLSALNAQFIKNFLNQDVKAHDQIIHKDFVCIESNGAIVDRATYLKNWATDFDNSGYTSFKYVEEFIRIFSNTALVRAKTIYTKTGEGKAKEGYTIYTDTYVKENGKWQCVQVQITPVQPGK